MRYQRLAIRLVMFVFLIMVAAMVTAGFSLILAHRVGLVELGLIGAERDLNLFHMLMWIMGISIVIGTVMSAFFSKRALEPIRKLIEATRRIAQGDFTVSVESKGINELEELAHSFNQMTRELSSIETLRSDFVNNFSHEFKTPIVSIRGFAKLLKDGNLSDEERQEYLEIIITESERLANLSTNVLNLSKYEAIEIITEKTSFYVDEQIRRAIAMAESRLVDKLINMDINLDEIEFSGNQDLTQQIWINLIDNAIKFCKEGGNIRIRLVELENAIHFTIQDDGIGMDDKVKTHVFDKFYQGDESHTQAGYGLGLTMVKRIVELHGGKITVDSSIGNGSVFVVVLPK